MQFRNLNEQYDRIKDKINAGIHEVISGSNFISGSKVKELEEKLAEYTVLLVLMGQMQLPLD